MTNAWYSASKMSAMTVTLSALAVSPASWTEFVDVIARCRFDTTLVETAEEALYEIGERPFDVIVVASPLGGIGRDGIVRASPATRSRAGARGDTIRRRRLGERVPRRSRRLDHPSPQLRVAAGAGDRADPSLACRAPPDSPAPPGRPTDRTRRSRHFEQAAAHAFASPDNAPVPPRRQRWRISVDGSAAGASHRASWSDLGVRLRH